MDCQEINTNTPKKYFLRKKPLKGEWYFWYNKCQR